MRLLRVVAGLLLLGGLFWGSLVLAVFLFGQRDEARPADAIVVLGAAQYQGKPSPVLRARLDHAISLHQRGLAPLLVLTGGVGVGDTISEAEVSRRYAIRAGVPRQAILLEGAGLSTEESMTTVAGLLEARGLSRVILVSDPFHMLRLRVLAARLGLSAFSSPTRSSPIVLNSPEDWKHILRESMILPVVFLWRR